MIHRIISRNWLTASSITDPIDLSEKHTIIITGGNCGLGYEAALDLAHRGASIVLACRNTNAGEKAVHDIRSITKNGKVECMELDLSSLRSVHKFAEEVRQNHRSIFALVCNAGVWMPMEREQKTEDGYELHFAVNHLGHFALIKELLPHLEISGIDSRIVLAASSLSKIGEINMDTKDFIKKGREQPKSISKSFAPSGYCDSKLMNILTARYLARMVEGSNVTVYSVCPGFCKSQLERHVVMPRIMKPFQRSTAQGAQNIVFVTVQNKCNLLSGGFYQDGQVNQKMLTAHKDVEQSLWDLSMELISNV